MRTLKSHLYPSHLPLPLKFLLSFRNVPHSHLSPTVSPRLLIVSPLVSLPLISPPFQSHRHTAAAGLGFLKLLSSHLPFSRTNVLIACHPNSNCFPGPRVAIPISLSHRGSLCSISNFLLFQVRIFTSYSILLAVSIWNGFSLFCSNSKHPPTSVPLAPRAAVLPHLTPGFCSNHEPQSCSALLARCHCIICIISARVLSLTTLGLASQVTTMRGFTQMSLQTVSI